MKQVKPAGGVRLLGSSQGSHLPRPTILKAGVRRAPDPEGHARALVRAHGLIQAADIAANNVAFTGDDYWRQVSATVSRMMYPSVRAH
jgi:hypothetical protein